MIWLFALYQNKQFNNMKTLIYNQTDEIKKSISEKLEYHEQHDDSRFSDLDRSIWLLRVRNAARDGVEFSDKEILDAAKKDTGKNPRS